MPGSPPRFDLWLLLPVAASLAPLLRGFAAGHDWSFELVRVAEFGHAVAAGQLPPAWAENLYAGYGSPVFLFYAPLFASVAACWTKLVGSVAWGCVAALATFSLGGALAMQRAAFLASGGSRTACRVAVALFVLHPYLVGNALLRNANAEFAALCVAPLVLTGVLELRESARRGAAWLGAGLALSILAHNLTALAVAAMAVVAGLWLPWPAQRRSGWGGLVGGLALGLAVSAFFWLPALALRDLVRTETMLVGKFDFHGQFPPLRAIFGYARFFGAGWLPAAVLAAGVALVFRQRASHSSEAHLLRLLVLGAVLLLMLMTPLSTPVWEHLPLLPYLQFPWRLQGPLALVTAIVAARLVADTARGLSPGALRVLEGAILLVALANALPQLLEARPLGTAERAWVERGLTPEAIRTGRKRATVLDEYLPRAADLRVLTAAAASPGALVALPASARVDVEQEEGTRLRLRVHTPAATRLTFARWSFPGWTARIDGKPVMLGADDRGRLQLDLAAGTRALDLRYQPPLSRRRGLALSSVVLAVWLGWWARESRRRRSR